MCFEFTCVNFVRCRMWFSAGTNFNLLQLVCSAVAVHNLCTAKGFLIYPKTDFS